MKRILFTGFLLFCGSAIVAAQNVTTPISGGMLNGKAISLPTPVYPERAKAERLEGTVRIEVVIDEAGNVISAEPATGLVEVYRPDGSGFPEKESANTADPILIEAARDAAMLARFAPTYLSGIPVKIKGTLVYNFVNGEDDDAKGPRGGGVLNGKAISMPAPTYPAAARAIKAQGSVSVQILIDEGGNVTKAEAISGHPLLRAASVAAAKEAKFSPTIIEGSVVKVAGVLTYNFVLPDSAGNP